MILNNKLDKMGERYAMIKRNGKKYIHSANDKTDRCHEKKGFFLEKDFIHRGRDVFNILNQIKGYGNKKT